MCHILLDDGTFDGGNTWGPTLVLPSPALGQMTEESLVGLTISSRGWWCFVSLVEEPAKCTTLFSWAKELWSCHRGGCLALWQGLVWVWPTEVHHVENRERSNSPKMKHVIMTQFRWTTEYISPWILTHTIWHIHIIMLWNAKLQVCNSDCTE